MNDSPQLSQVIQRHRSYIYLNLVWYFAFLGLIALGMLTILPSLAAQPEIEVSPEMVTGLGWGIKFMAIYGIGMFAFNLYLLTPQYNSKWWTLALVNIGLGMTTCLLAPFCFKLASDWNTPLVKASFRVPTQDGPTRR